jgi:transcriptional regulator with XRE-family HTH domain
MARKKLSQTALADRLGWKQQYLSRRLTGHISFTLDELEQISAALNVSLADLGLPMRKAVRS